ncbi:hypothetical protein [Pontiella desulfatans]|nr:hypothetical protein [Pontiella desulfatans]
MKSTRRTCGAAALTERVNATEYQQAANTVLEIPISLTNHCMFYKAFEQ